jgi:hypothetical protein
VKQADGPIARMHAPLNLYFAMASLLVFSALATSLSVQIESRTNQFRRSLDHDVRLSGQY